MDAVRCAPENSATLLVTTPQGVDVGIITGPAIKIRRHRLNGQPSYTEMVRRAVAMALQLYCDTATATARSKSSGTPAQVAIEGVHGGEVLKSQSAQERSGATPAIAARGHRGRAQRLIVTVGGRLHREGFGAP